jgi:hypothetical protein
VYWVSARVIDGVVRGVCTPRDGKRIPYIHFESILVVGRSTESHRTYSGFAHQEFTSARSSRNDTTTDVTSP